VCADALIIIGALSRNGFLNGDRTVSKAFADLISRYQKTLPPNPLTPALSTPSPLNPTHLTPSPLNPYI
jgi:hypothetical protein